MEGPLVVGGRGGGTVLLTSPQSGAHSGTVSPVTTGV